MKNITTLIIICSFSIFSSRAQTANFNFAINNINAAVLNGGDLFSPAVAVHGGCEVPKGSGKYTIYAAGLWIGGIDAQQKLHMSAVTYRQEGQVFEPGPVSNQMYSAKATRYDKIFYITQTEISYHIQHYKDANYTPANSIAIWPGNGDIGKGEAARLAPFNDINKNSIYEPMLGEYPIFPGDACAFTIFNDKINSDGLGIEVHQFVYGYNDPSSVLNNTLFVSYKIFNRSANNYANVHIGHWIDYDLGNYADDGLCVDSTRNMVYVYNKDEDDDGTLGYGINPPAMGCVILNNPLTSASYYDNDFTNSGNPTTLQHYYNYLRGYFKNGLPEPKLPCDFGGNSPGDRRIIGSSGPFSLGSNKEFCFTLAHIYARASSGGVKSSIDLLKQSSDFVRKYFNNGWVDDACPAYWATGINKTVTKSHNLNIYPNPVKNEISIQLNIDEQGDKSFVIVNSLGQIVSSGDLRNPKTSIDVSELAPGVYFIKVGEKSAKFFKD